VRRPADKLYVQTLSIGCAVRRIIRSATSLVGCLTWVMLGWILTNTVFGFGKLLLCASRNLTHRLTYFCVKQIA
jgi:hypothetical protein